MTGLVFSGSLDDPAVRDNYGREQMSETQDGLASEDLQRRAALSGSRPALIERFGIRGLYGYRDVSLSSQHAATILMARNGSGKTTILSALDAFLKMQLNRLRGTDFSEIYCKLRGTEEELVITSDDLSAMFQVSSSPEFGNFSSKFGIESHKFFDFILSGYERSIRNWYNENEVNSLATAILRHFGHDVSAAVKSCDQAYEYIFVKNPRINIVRLTLAKVLSGYEIVYLPTYRRVELALTDDDDGRRRRGKSKQKLSLQATGLHAPEIQFGLADISERLFELNGDIINRSNREYRKISENIINELIRGYEVSDDAEIPKPDDLKLFFSRIESGKRMMGPYYSKISAPDFERIYSREGVSPESSKFLRYFLNKLNGIINITKEIEQPVGDFVRSCNRYLSLPEPSAYPSDEARRNHLKTFDAKALRLDPNDLSVRVESLPGRDDLSIDILSSGEKQMVSLFARMYLYPDRKIVLIDEPELSLSIDWQRGILIDVLLSPNCEQVVAITHSPFVFDNSLEPFARTLELRPSAESADRFAPNPETFGDEVYGPNG